MEDEHTDVHDEPIPNTDGQRWGDPPAGTGGEAVAKGTDASGRPGPFLQPVRNAGDVVATTGEEYGEVAVAQDFVTINNMWSTADATQRTYRYADGTYGWGWERGDTGEPNPNYPQALVGTKPWGEDTGAAAFPVRRGDLDEFEMTLDVDATVVGDEWNLMEEWWLTTERPGDGRDVSDSIAHEISLVLEWGTDHGHGEPIESAAVTDAYGTTIDYWARYDIGWDFRIFRVAANEVPEALDFTAIVEYVTEHFGADGDLWLSGVEVGNEYWDGTGGATAFREFAVTVDGTTAESGADCPRDE